MNELAQIRTIAKLEIGRAFFSRRALWVYLLALFPAVIFIGHGVAVRSTCSVGTLAESLQPTCWKDLEMGPALKMSWKKPVSRSSTANGIAGEIGKSRKI